MYQKLQELRSAKEEREGGFTLIELLVVVVIIGILVAIAIPLYLNYQKGAHDKAAASDLRNAVPVLNQCYSENSNAFPQAAALFSDSLLTNAVANAADMTGTIYLKCGSDSEQINLSDQTHADYIPATDGSSFELKMWNIGGKKNSVSNSYDYKSTNGGVVGP